MKQFFRRNISQNIQKNHSSTTASNKNALHLKFLSILRIHG